MGYKVSYIILTHCHFDHISAVPELVSETGAKLLLGASEKENYFSQNVNLSNYFPGVLNLPEPDAVLEDGEILHAGEYSFQVIATPGHTSGSICLLVNDCLFSGDTLFRQSIGRTDLPTGNLRSLVNSIKNRLFVLNDEISVYAGHGPSSNIGYEKKHNEVHEWEKYC